jgi:UDP-hydrolysing UDP-N-acetyl-D-glucosamine 2-epimerase
VVTVARSDYGIYLPILKKIQIDPELDLHILAGGMHLSPEFGMTVEAIEADGFAVEERIEMLLSSDSPEGIAKSMGLGLIGFSQAYAHKRPDILLTLGDRFEMHSAALAALPFNIPVAHIHGGEVTQGAIDDALRHSLTKLSHLHFVATDEYARRVIQLGEDSARVVVTGAPALDNLRSIELLDRSEVEERCGLHFSVPPLLITFHPVTLEFEHTEDYIDQLLNALVSWDVPMVFTQPNADTRGRVIAEKIAGFAATHANAQVVDNLGTQGYFSLMAIAAAMVGNSSSGIIESPSFKLPVVNIGTRQEGRIRAVNVIDVGYAKDEIERGIAQALSVKFRASLVQLVNPYGDELASEKIVDHLKCVALGDQLLRKKFRDIEGLLPVGYPVANEAL